MKRNTMLKVLNPILALLVVSQVTTGIFQEDIPKEIFEWVHATGGFGVAICSLLHLVLNWSWVKTNFFARRAGA
ncbi:MAG: hypothetical protein ACOYOU_14080 [Kiritimatiellia bacterium]